MHKREQTVADMNKHERMHPIMNNVESGDAALAPASWQALAFRLKQKLMAKLDSNFSFIGTIGNVTAYRLPGVKGVIIRRKGGATARQIREGRNYENTRRMNMEFAGRSACVKLLARILWPLSRLADHNIYGPLHALMNVVQKADTKSSLGKRNVCLSRNPALLTSFAFNRDTSFSRIVRPQLEQTLSREHGMATVSIPSLIPGINFHPTPNHPMFRIVAVLGLLPDMFYRNEKYSPSHNDYNQFAPVITTSEWFSTREVSPGLSFSLSLPYSAPDAHFSMILGIGYEAGFPENRNSFVGMKREGAAEIVMVQ